MPEIKEKVCRIYSKFRNEILSYDFDFYELPEWSIHHKLLKKQYEQDLKTIVLKWDPKKRDISYFAKRVIE